MAKSPRNDDPRAERGDSQQSSGTYVEVVGTPRRRKRGQSAAPRDGAQADGASRAAAASPEPAKRESVRPSAIPAEQIRLPSGAVAYVSPAVPRSSRTHGLAREERTPPSSELHLDAPSWIDSGPTDRNYPPHTTGFTAPRQIREVVPRRIEAEREQVERASRPHIVTEARQSRVENVRESTRPRASAEASHESIPSESTRPRAVIDCIPDETTQARARLSAVQASLALATRSERPPAMTESVPPPASGASVLDAKPQMVSEPPEPRRTSWPLIGAVAMLCSIISAAGVVAFREAQDSSTVARSTVVAPTPIKIQVSREMRAADPSVQPSPAPAEVAPAAPAVTVSPLAVGEPLAAPMPEPAPAVAAIDPQPAPVVAAPAQPVEVATTAPLAPQVSALLAPAPSAPAVGNRRSAAHVATPSAAAAPVTANDSATHVEVAALPATGLNPVETKAVLSQLAAEERATAEADALKREEERKLPSTARLKAPSVRIEASRIAAAIRKASQDAVARANEQQAPATAPAEPKAEPKASDNLPDNPF